VIELVDVTKAYSTAAGKTPILNGVNFALQRGQSIGILGRNGAGKSTLLRIIGGAELPDTGKVERTMSVSWPLAFAGGFQSSLTGADNVRFICRIYGVDPDASMAYVEEFSELGIYLHEPVRTYSSGMRARLAFASSMVVEFDCYLIDEIVAVGDSRFQAKCHQELFVKRADRARIIVSHDANYIREHCDRVAVMLNGKLLDFGSVDEAFDAYTEAMA